MNLVIQGSPNFTLSDRLKDYISKRISKIDYFKPYINEINFHLDSEKINFKVDVTIKTHKFGTFKFEAKDREMYTAIDKIVHKIDVKIYREKSKFKDHSRPGHEALIEFFDHHEEDKPEPTKVVDINQKPTTLEDAYLHMKQNHQDFFGFYMIEEDSNPSPAFIRKLSDDVLYLFKKKNPDQYVEYSLETTEDTAKIKDEIRTIDLTKTDLLSAQKDVLDQDFHFDLFVDNHSDKISFLFKEDNGKWRMLA